LKLVEYVVSVLQGQVGHIGYLVEKEGACGVTFHRAKATVFLDQGAAKVSASRYIQDRLDDGSLFTSNTPSIGFKVEAQFCDGAFSTPLTDGGAEELLGVLKAHYGEPVLTRSAFLGALSKWFRCTEQANAEAADDTKKGCTYYQQLSCIELDIKKSELLARLLRGEPLRTRKCPEHKGAWSGFEYPGKRCSHGCQLTGWLPENTPEKNLG